MGLDTALHQHPCFPLLSRDMCWGGRGDLEEALAGASAPRGYPRTWSRQSSTLGL